MMTRIVIPATSTADWQRLLADPEKHWKSGHSAKALAECWQNAEDFPASVRTVLDSSPFPRFHALTMLLGLPEHQVPLPGGSRPSQTDLFVLAKTTTGDLVSIAVEGKVAEPFGPRVSEWLDADATGPSSGKLERLAYLCPVLRISEDEAQQIRYQLIHRTVSALVEADRFNASLALMLVHSFGSEDVGFEDFGAFAQLLGTAAEPNTVSHVGERAGVDLYLGWARGETEFLAL
jgi:hypothetical protein